MLSNRVDELSIQILECESRPIKPKNSNKIKKQVEKVKVMKRSLDKVSNDIGKDIKEMTKSVPINENLCRSVLSSIKSKSPFKKSKKTMGYVSKPVRKVKARSIAKRRSAPRKSRAAVQKKQRSRKKSVMKSIGKSLNRSTKGAKRSLKRSAKGAKRSLKRSAKGAKRSLGKMAYKGKSTKRRSSVVKK